MSAVSRLNDSIRGMTSGEHSSHDDPPCTPSTLTGFISGNCSDFVFINNVPVATVGSITTEYDSCCGQDNGVIVSGSTLVSVSNKALARVGSVVSPHNGSATVTSGSDFVFTE